MTLMTTISTLFHLPTSMLKPKAQLRTPQMKMTMMSLQTKSQLRSKKIMRTTMTPTTMMMSQTILTMMTTKMMKRTKNNVTGLA